MRLGKKVNAKLQSQWRQELETRGFKLSQTKHREYNFSTNEITIGTIKLEYENGSSECFENLGSIFHRQDIQQDVSVGGKSGDRSVPLKSKGMFY